MESNKQEIQPKKEARENTTATAAQQAWRGIHPKKSRRTENCKVGECLQEKKKRNGLITNMFESLERKFQFLSEILWINW